MSSEPTLTGMLSLIAANLPPGPALPRSPDPTKTPYSSWREEIIVTYCVGQGKFSSGADFNPSVQYINLQMDMFDISGKWIGYQLGVHESHSTPQDLLSVPPLAAPYNQPPVPHPAGATKEWTKGVWTFEDGSKIYAVGPAWSHLVPFNDGSFLFMVTTGQTIVKGTGRYEGAHGIKEATGTAFVPAGLIQSGQFPAPGLQFIAKTIEVFRIVKKQDLGPDTLNIDAQAQAPAAPASSPAAPSEAPTKSSKSS